MAEHEFDEIVMLRSVLEPIALGFARQRATSADLTRVRKLLRNLEGVARRGDQRAYIGKDYEFHVAIWELSGQPLLTEVLKRISAPVFVFEAMLEERYRRADYDVIADARAHQSLLDYLEGNTQSDAGTCLKPLLELALRAEKPIVFSTPERRR
jgi:DNA-binding GntR family transcriptional regulator